MSKEKPKFCKICELETAELDEHHLIPLSQGGNSSKKNKIFICKDCHYKLHHPDWEDGDLEQFHKSFKDAFDQNIFSDGWGILPSKIAHDNEITSFAKILYCEISSLCAEKGYCWASNKYLASKFNVSVTTISTTMTSLEKYLVFEHRTSFRRKIWVHTLNSKPIRNLNSNLSKNLKVNLKENLKDNNNKSNNKSNNINNNIAEINSAKIIIPDLLKDKQRHIQIIGLFARAKGIVFTSKEQQSSFIRRNLRPAKDLSAYDNDKIIETMRYLIKNTEIDWKLETVGKYIDEMDLIV